MTQPEIPDVPAFFTRADIPGIAAEAGEAVTGGGGFNIGDVEGWFKFAERAERLIEKAGATIMRMQEFSANGNRSNVVTPAEPMDNGRVMQAEPVQESAPAQAGQITADAVYMKCLAAINEVRKRDPDMTVSELLKQARIFRPLVLEGIQKALVEIVTADPEVYADIALEPE